MPNNSLKPGTKVKYYDARRPFNKNGIVVAPSRQGPECVIVEWNEENYPVSIVNLDDLLEIPD